MKFRKDDIIFLLGAGVSADAEVPTSSMMLEELENLIKSFNDWKDFKDLYFLIKSGVGFSYGIQGKDAIFNIEILVNTLNELEKKEMHPLYPFIGSWHIKFNEVVGNNFSLIAEFRKKIIQKLKSWVSPMDLRKSEYLEKLGKLQKEINFSIRIFTLNYDLLIEKKLNDFKIERGFDEDTRKWNYKRFMEPPQEPDIYLYKLHGSIDWRRENNDVQWVDSIPDEPDLIFGIQYKMQYFDPYLFMISELRYYCFKAKLIVCLGYSFSDEHINAILSQALSQNRNTKLFALAYGEKEEKIKNLFSLEDNQAKIITHKTAKDFFENDLKLQTFEELFPESEESII